MSTFFGSGVSGLSASAAANGVGGAILDLTGYIYITADEAANGVNISCSSDDGSQLYVGGTALDGPATNEHGSGFGSTSTLTFTNGAGYYSIELQYFETTTDPRRWASPAAFSREAVPVLSARPILPPDRTSQLPRICLPPHPPAPRKRRPSR